MVALDDLAEEDRRAIRSLALQQIRTKPEKLSKDEIAVSHLVYKCLLARLRKTHQKVPRKRREEHAAFVTRQILHLIVRAGRDFQPMPGLVEKSSHGRG